MYFVPFANGRTPPVVVVVILLYIHLQARQTPEYPLNYFSLQNKRGEMDG